jgi:glycosyltransferase involved in cell wall biosynthesis
VQVLFVGRLVEKKAPVTAIAAVAALSAERQCPASLTMLGDGPLAATVAAAAEAASVTVSMAGACSADDVRRQMRAADVLLFTSTDGIAGDREGLPNVIVEAMACGLPVVGTRVGSVDDILDETTGYPVGDGDVPALAAALASVMQAPEAAGARAAAARARVVADFDAHTLIQRRVALLRSVAGLG